MNNEIFVLDALENASYGAQRAIRDDVADMDACLRRAMDKGLTTDEMKTAQAARAAVQSASVILDKLFA